MNSPLSKINDMASGRKILRNLAAATHPTYGETFLDRTEPSSSRSGTASAHEHLRADNQANRTHIRSIAGMFDVLAETNPALAQMCQNVRPTINPDPTPEEQTDLEQRSAHRSAEIFDDINLNN
ncbi:hypothetical protein F2Q69_00036553 [Brassica cretica]|uniref:Uncharacterized protein n=1 Tax=Brassica cretica TaxID=69181 RepID=A0A8S9SEC2_BRACR|nr:hypothetical protein F2Q69_00036553 [Brassica cretica]